jgi:hypothetical protein
MGHLVPAIETEVASVLASEHPMCSRSEVQIRCSHHPDPWLTSLNEWERRLGRVEAFIQIMRPNINTEYTKQGVLVAAVG